MMAANLPFHCLFPILMWAVMYISICALIKHRSITIWSDSIKYQIFSFENILQMEYLSGDLQLKCQCSHNQKVS